MIKHRSELWKVVTVPGHAAEIGVAEGRFSSEILSWPIHFEKVYLVDRWSCCPFQKGDASNPDKWHTKNHMEVVERVKPFNGRAVLLKGDSAAMASHVPNQSLSLLYIDGDHSYAGVMGDLAAWRSKVKPGGVIAFHDYLAKEYGVNAAVKDYAKSCNLTIIDIPENHPQDAGAYFVVC